ncbi:phage tail protein [Novosphingobium mathurense]|uniref:p2 phage tail completion protein R (GpR) n=1 Tax=Novosphingobium mathurense TaxID=428990 RepID=A0A1U6INN6_9SPHN|nr:phage tail protein [Novosphingobium mathurense]SLK09597.1 P2 phage tail completion protein R (GpR) [Novosphingobium mathurense]
MRKADSLRRWLTAFLPDLKTHPDRLQVYLEGGQIGARRSATLSFAYAYTVKALITDFAGDTDTIMVAVLAWIEKEQPQLLQASDGKPFQFEAELLDSETYDIELSIDLTEPVLVIPRADSSGYDVNHPEEPAFPPMFDGVTASFLQGFGNVDLLAETTDPDAVLTPAVPPDA